MSYFSTSKNGRKYYNYRVKGRFAKRPQQPQQIKYYDNEQNIPEYVYVPEKEDYEKLTYRAVVTLNGVPIQSHINKIDRDIKILVGLKLIIMRI